MPDVTPSYDSLAPGVVFADRYELVRLLGQGGFGKVFLAKDLTLELPVALKVLNPGLADDENQIKRFRREVIVARKIAHRNVCKLFDIGQVGNVVYLTMEYIEGQDLARLLAQHGAFPVRPGLEICLQICAALDAAHREGVVHRDLKPHNVILDRDATAKILDFGIARSADTHAVTATGMMMGTPTYMSPEQARGEQGDGRSDLYSLGVMMYQLFTGTVPFTAETPLGVLFKHVQSPARPPAELNPALPAAVNDIILRCLAKSVEQRYQSAQEVMLDIEHVLDAEPTATGGQAPPRSPTRPQRAPTGAQKAPAGAQKAPTGAQKAPAAARRPPIAGPPREMPAGPPRESTLPTLVPGRSTASHLRTSGVAERSLPPPAAGEPESLDPWDEPIPTAAAARRAAAESADELPEEAAERAGEPGDADLASQHSSRSPVLVALLALLLVSFAGALVLVGPKLWSRAPDPGDAVAARTPVAPSAGGGGTLPIEVRPPVVAAPPAIATEAEPPGVATPPAEAEPPAVLAPAATPAGPSLVAATGILSVFCMQDGCSVRVDGKELGQTRKGQYLTLPVPAGEIELVVTKEGFEPFLQKVALLPSGKQEIIAQLEPLGATPPPSAQARIQPLGFRRPGSTELTQDATFAPSDPIEFLARVEGAPQGAGVVGSWIAEDVGAAAPPESFIASAQFEIGAGPTDASSFALSPPAGGFPAGLYRLEIRLGEVLLHRQPFRIEAAQPPTAVPASAAAPTPPPQVAAASRPTAAPAKPAARPTPRPTRPPAARPSPRPPQPPAAAAGGETTSWAGAFQQAGEQAAVGLQIVEQGNGKLAAAMIVNVVEAFPPPDGPPTRIQVQRYLFGSRKGRKIELHSTASKVTVVETGQVVERPASELGLTGTIAKDGQSLGATFSNGVQISFQRWKD